MFRSEKITPNTSLASSWTLNLPPRPDWWLSPWSFEPIEERLSAARVTGGESAVAAAEEDGRKVRSRWPLLDVYALTWEKSGSIRNQQIGIWGLTAPVKEVKGVYRHDSCL